MFVSDQEQYILIACDSKIEEEAIQNRVYASDVAHSEKRVSRKKAVVESVGVMECVTESNICGASRKTVTETVTEKHDLCSVMEKCNIPKFLLTQHSYYSTND